MLPYFSQLDITTMPVTLVGMCVKCGTFLCLQSRISLQVTMSADTLMEVLLCHRSVLGSIMQINQMYSEPCDGEDKDDGNKHKEEGERWWKLDEGDRGKISAEFEKHGHPLNEQHPSLYNICKGQVAPDTVNVQDALIIRKERSDNFYSSLSETFHTTIKKKVKTMEILKKPVTAEQAGPSNEARHIERFGWVVEGSTVTPAVSTAQVAPQILLYVVSCSCTAEGKARNTARCNCDSSGLPCTDYCKCEGREPCCSPFTNRHNDNDDDQEKLEMGIDGWVLVCSLNYELFVWVATVWIQLLLCLKVEFWMISLLRCNQSLWYQFWSKRAIRT